MGKALMVAATNLAHTTLQEISLFGYNSRTSTEANAQVQATEGATFSKLGINIVSGGSGTNNFQFRDAGANGNQLATRAGTGTAEDATNTDVLTAGDLFNLAYTDTGTDSVCSWVKCNVEFASGHGNFHGAAGYGGIVFDAASSTTFIMLGGGLLPDGTATEDDVGFKIRAYSTFEALQVRVTANARTNDSVFRNRINKGNGTGVITFGSGVTGLITATGLADAIAAGQVVNASITLLTGVEDLTVSLVVGTFKSATNKSESWIGSPGVARTASATADYFPIGGNIPALTGLTEAQNRIKVGFAGAASNLRCYLSTNTYTVNATLKLFKNGAAVMTTTLTAAGGAAWYENIINTVGFTATDELSFEIVGGTSGSIEIEMIGITLLPELVTSYGSLHHITCGIGDTGTATVPQTLHTIEHGIAA